ncbi:MAG: hypothetical protein VX357_02735 [Pseudomonadota bacterium]
MLLRSLDAGCNLLVLYRDHGLNELRCLRVFDGSGPLGGAAPARRNKALIDSAPAATPMQPAAGIPAEPAVPAAATAPAAATPAPEKPAAPSAASGADDLTRIKGVGPKLSSTLNAMGVTSFAQIAAWDEAEIDRIDAQLGRFQGRIRRDDWVGQASLLAAGDDSGFAQRYGKLS